MADDNPPPQLQPGDLCHHGSNLLPTYKVVWIDGDKAWLRDVNTGQDAVVSLANCHKHGFTEVGGAETALTPAGLTWPDGTPRP